MPSLICALVLHLAKKWQMQGRMKNQLMDKNFEPPLFASLQQPNISCLTAVLRHRHKCRAIHIFFSKQHHRLHKCSPNTQMSLPAGQVVVVGLGLGMQNETSEEVAGAKRCLGWLHNILCFWYQAPGKGWTGTTWVWPFSEQGSLLRCPQAPGWQQGLMTRPQASFKNITIYSIFTETAKTETVYLIHSVF